MVVFLMSGGGVVLPNVRGRFVAARRGVKPGGGNILGTIPRLAVENNTTLATLYTGLRALLGRTHVKQHASRRLRLE